MENSKKFFKLIERSSNSKTGPIATTISSMNSCPNTCPLRPKELGGNGSCYASSGFYQKLAWKKVSENSDGRSTDWSGFIKKLRNLKIGKMIRFNTAGDLVSTKKGKINRNNLMQLIKVVKERDLNSIIYTHVKDDAGIEWSWQQGFPLIKSCDKIEQINPNVANSIVISHENERTASESFADWRNRLRIATDILKQETGTQGRVFVCPAQILDNVTCASCGACSKNQIRAGDIVAFIAHSVKKKSVETEV